MKKVLVKAFEIYKEIDNMSRDEEYRVREAIADAPLKYWVESEPDTEVVSKLLTIATSDKNFIDFFHHKIG